MDPTKGIHAGLTFLAAIVFTYLTWDLWNNTLGTISTEPIHSMLWISYILSTLIFAIVIPLLIASSDDSDDVKPSIVSAVVMYGYTAVAVIGMRIAYPIIDTFTDVLTETYSLSIVGFLVLIGVFMVLYVMPIAIGAFPGIFEEPVKKAINKALG